MVAPEHAFDALDTHNVQIEFATPLRASLSSLSSWNHDDTSVRVAVRVRPFVPREVLCGSRPCVSVDGGDKSITIGRSRRFTFDNVFSPEASQVQVYNDCVSSLVDSCLDGYNATVLAYGQTGSGKTYTLGKDSSLQGDSERCGIAPRVIRQLFNSMNAKKPAVKYTVFAQFLEIYNEEVHDLLHHSPKVLSIRETPDGQVLVHGASEHLVDSPQELLQLLHLGCCSRVTNGTLMNEASSRSHAIFTITIVQQIPAAQGQGPEVRRSRFHLVDLAGSERSKKSGAVGARLKETVNINQGLLALGNVISALGDERKRGSHVPYRESRLTRLLQNSLGGNSKTLMVACVGSGDDSLEETLNTLKYANRARNIRNKPILNREASSPLLLMQAQLAEMQSSLVRQLLSALPPHLATDPMLTELLVQQASNVCSFTPGAPGLFTPGSNIGSERGPSTDALQQHVYSLKRELSELKLSKQLMQRQAEEMNRALSNLMNEMAELEACGLVSATVRERILNALEASLQNPVDFSTPGISTSPEAFHAASRDPSRPSGRLQHVSTQDQALQSHPINMALSMSLQSETMSMAINREQEMLVLNMMERAQDLEQQLSEKTAELAYVNKALEEAKDDLERDEIIFSNQNKEIAELRETLANQQEQQMLTIQSHMSQVSELQLQLKTLQARSHSSPGKRYEALVHTHTASPLSGAARATAAPHRMEGGIVDEDEVLYDDDLLSYISETDYTDQHATSLEAENNELALELQRALSSRAAAEQQREDLEAAAELQQREWVSTQAALEAEVAALADAINFKEETIVQLSASELEARRAATAAMARVRELENAISDKEAELAAMRRDLAEVEGDMARSGEERAALVAEYEQRIKAACAQVAALSTALREAEEAQRKRDFARSAGRVAALETELNHMRRAHSEISARMRERQTAQERTAASRARELATLRKTADSARRRVAELEAENRQQRLVIQSKIEEAAVSQQRLRNALASRKPGTVPQVPPPLPQPQGLNARQAAETKVARSTSTSRRPPLNAGTRASQGSTRSSLARSSGGSEVVQPSQARAAEFALLLEECMKVEKELYVASTAHATLLARINTLKQQRNEVMQSQSQQQLRKARRSTDMRTELMELELRLAGMLARRPTPRRSSGLVDEVQSQQELMDVKHKFDMVKEQLDSGNFLDQEDQEELDAIQESVEDVDRELKSATRALEHAKDSEAEAIATRSKLRHCFEGLSLQDARLALLVSLDFVKDVWVSKCKVEEKVNSLEAVHADAVHQLGELQSCAQQQDQRHQQEMSRLRESHRVGVYEMLTGMKNSLSSEAASSRRSTSSSTGEASEEYMPSLAARPTTALSASLRHLIDMFKAGDSSAKYDNMPRARSTTSSAGTSGGSLGVRDTSVGVGAAAESLGDRMFVPEAMPTVLEATVMTPGNITTDSHQLPSSARLPTTTHVKQPDQRPLAPMSSMRGISSSPGSLPEATRSSNGSLQSSGSLSCRTSVASEPALRSVVSHPGCATAATAAAPRLLRSSTPMSLDQVNLLKAYARRRGMLP